MGVTEVIYALIAVIWGLNLFEIRELRKDNKLLSGNIAALTATIANLTANLDHKMEKEACTAYRMGLVRNGK